MTLTYREKLATIAERPGRASAVRRREAIDTLPEITQYHDDGCEVSPFCLECPLPRCKYDDPEWYRRLRLLSRDARVLEAQRREAKSAVELAQQFGVSLRTVQRIVKRARASSAPFSCRACPERSRRKKGATGG